MDEQELERRLAGLKETWRISPDPPLGLMWQQIEQQAFPPREQRTPARWVRRLLPLAATLVLGFGLGQLSPGLLRRGTGPALAGSPVDSVVARAVAAEPFVGVATDYLERVTALLVTLTDLGGKSAQRVDYSVSQARDLLGTTRLLLDSPQAHDPRLQALLNDLELVLAQIVRLPNRAPAPDVYLIDQAVDQREVLPRLREMLAENSSSQP